MKHPYPYSPDERKILEAIGRGDLAAQLVVTLKRMRSHYASIDSIDGSGDYGAQVEGRRIFVEFIDDLTAQVAPKPRTLARPPVGDDDGL